MHRIGSNEYFDRVKPASLLQHETLGDVAVGSFAAEPFSPRTDRCPLWSESDLSRQVSEWSRSPKLGSRHDAISKFELVERSILLV
jgi:hypothetical protein